MAAFTLRIDAMHCGACIRRVTQSLQAVPSVTVEEVRLGAARVNCGPNADPEAMISALNKAGFSAQVEK